MTSTHERCPICGGELSTAPTLLLLLILLFILKFVSLFLCVCGTVVLVFDGEAEDVAGPEAGAVVHTAVEQRVGVGVLDVQDLARGRHVTRDALIGGDSKLFLHRHTQAKISKLVFAPSASNWLLSDRK